MENGDVPLTFDRYDKFAFLNFSMDGSMSMAFASIKPDMTSSTTRCLTDGCNYLWVF